MSTVDERKERIKSIVAETLEIEPENMTESALFQQDYGADSLRSIEILASLEKEFKVEIPQAELSEMSSLANVYTVVKKYAVWGD